MNLEASARSLREWEPSAESADLIRREQRIERFGQFAFGGFGIVLLVAVAGIIYTILTKMVLAGTQPLVGILLIAFIIFAVLTLGYVAFNEDLKERRKKSRWSSPAEIEAAVVTGKLLEEKEFEAVPTVTENTTELLPTRKREH
jgi:hypothetical protein